MEDRTRYLIDQWEKMQSGEKDPAFEARLREDSALDEEWNALCLAMEAVKEEGLRQQVGAIASGYRNAAPRKGVTGTAPIRSMIRYVSRVAAVLVLLAGVAGIYRFTTMNPSRFYHDNFSGYDLSTARGATHGDSLERAYREKHWQEVVSQFEALQPVDNKSGFLAGMSMLELDSPARAIGFFENILDHSARGTETSYHDEAEFYQALAFMANNEPARAIPILERIRADKEHLYHEAVRRMSWLDLRILWQKKG